MTRSAKMGLIALIVHVPNSFGIADARSKSLCESSSSFKLNDLQRGEIQALEKERQKKGLPVEANDKKVFVVTASSNGKPIPIKAVSFTASIKPAKGTVVYLCGGPAICTNLRPWNVPKDYNVVTFDYLGLGDNKLGPAPPELMSLESQGLAVKKIIEALKIKNYVLYGQSFGTAVATIAAAQIAKDKMLAQPKSVILEGTIGARHTDGVTGYIQFAQRTWDLVSPEEKIRFRTALAENMRSLSKENQKVLNYIFTQELYLAPKQAAQYLQDWARLSADERKRQAEQYQDERLVNSVLYKRMYQSAGCQISNSVGSKEIRILEGLIVLPYSYELCACRFIARDYDSKNFQIKAALIYINSESDAATPLEGALYHFEHQTLALNKAFIRVPDASHVPTWEELAGCNDRIFNAAFSTDLSTLRGPRDFSRRCALPSSTQNESTVR